MPKTALKDLMEQEPYWKWQTYHDISHGLEYHFVQTEYKKVAKFRS